MAQTLSSSRCWRRELSILPATPPPRVRPPTASWPIAGIAKFKMWRQGCAIFCIFLGLSGRIMTNCTDNTGAKILYVICEVDQEWPKDFPELLWVTW
ncbi:hypothetical protein QTO34_019911 [Cnephaeus nilssonii]|uniref:Uncharacterized protein n=1 Tax=Cnephaeus nilssonii TaxID=3371016 RepID=A0AA40HXQ6_CNENI|nr:hypothetical protein QTO34_019911 [Eptesicus nilssonii]